MNKKKSNSFLLKNRVRLVTINPSYPYFGFIIGRDDDFIFLDTGDYQGVMAFPFYNINKIVEEKKELMKQ